MWEEGPRLPTVGGTEGDSEGLGFSVGGWRRERDCLSKRPTEHQIPDQGARFKRGPCLMQVDINWGMSGFCFLGNAVPSKPRNCYQPRQNA